jgi:hypothetical protein
MIQSIRDYTSLSATTEVTYNFNCNVLNGLLIHNSLKNSELKVSVRVGRYQLISDTSLAGLNAILAPKLKNLQDTQFLIPFGNLDVRNQTMTITLENTGVASKTVGLSLIYDNGKAINKQPVCYKTYTSGEFSSSNVVSCAFFSGGTGSLISSTEKFTWSHDGKSETVDAQSYESLWTSLSNNTGTVGKQALIVNGKASTLNMSGPYTTLDEYIVAYI